jgi:4-hydroxybenzoate polyprenyltransferase
MAVAYSHPAIALKGHPIGGPAINALGYGLLSPLAGWAAVGVPMNLRTSVALAVLLPAVLAWYFAAQAFQRDEDVDRGYRTLVVTHGAPVTLAVSRVLFAMSWVGLVSMAVAGWLPRVVLVVIPFLVIADRRLLRWSLAPHGSLMLAFAVLLASVSGVYVRDSFRPGPVAGLATAAGLPNDRPQLDPTRLRRTEALGSPSDSGVALRRPRF